MSQTYPNPCGCAVHLHDCINCWVKVELYEGHAISFEPNYEGKATLMKLYTHFIQGIHF